MVLSLIFLKKNLKELKKKYFLRFHVSARTGFPRTIPNQHEQGVLPHVKRRRKSGATSGPAYV